MMRIMNKSRSIVATCFLLITIGISLASNSFLSPQYSLEDQSNLIPFNKLYLNYSIKGNKNGIPLFASFNVSYTKLENNSINSYDYNVSIVLQPPLLSKENASLFENSSTRTILLNSAQGTYISFVILEVFPFNSSINALNWDPFWIIPTDVNTTYPIYSLFLNVTDRTTIGPSDVSALSYTTPAIVFKGNQTLDTPDSNVTSTVGLIYDNYTGFLLYGTVNTIITSQDTTNKYYAVFSLTATNGFAAFPPYPTTSQSSNIFIPQALQKPNYILLALIIIFPILVTISRFLRLKEISGGLK